MKQMVHFPDKLQVQDNILCAAKQVSYSFITTDRSDRRMREKDARESRLIVEELRKSVVLEVQEAINQMKRKNDYRELQLKATLRLLTSNLEDTKKTYTEIFERFLATQRDVDSLLN
ncbi:uncharacterized protein LOC125043481 [Penaeus chinensis]|uniref:uncharacterized protein LOC125043481 n=1 Tax=Penaeus chinensis TaxID=139456 RepID=UPI001FB5A4D2|nr:uncharacterized protein LOC125043481 [Penaeus chinensis]